MESLSSGLANARAMLARAARFLTLRPQKRPFQSPSDWTIGGFATTSLVLWIVFDRLRYGHDATFIPYGAPELTWYVLPGLLAAWLVSRTTRPGIDFRSCLFLIVVLAPALIACAFAVNVSASAGLGKAAAIGAVVYVIVYLAAALRDLTGRPQLRALAVTVVFAALFIAFDSSLYVSPTLWTDPDGEEAAERQAERVDAEDLLISQPARIDAMVARTAPSQTTQAHVYFVGFAGVGSQKVFAEEIKLAARRITERYGSSDRTLLLLNDRRDFDSYPLATSSGLKLALRGIASRMNVDRDVLFLALSSHGSAAPELSVSNGMLPLRDLTGKALATALRDSGIKWKVIVISACHAGAFIDTLRDEYTIVLTAAAPDRTSFGCSDDRDLTYFGEAFYRDALPGSASLRDAFDRARQDIASREQRERIEASQPQAFFGAAMERKMTEFETRNTRPTQP